MDKERDSNGSGYFAEIEAGPKSLVDLPCSALDAGLVLAVEMKWRLLALCLLPLGVELVYAYRQYVQPLGRGSLFLLIVINLLAKSWLLAAVTLTCIERLRAVRSGFFALARRAFVYLPKVLLSYLILWILIVYSLRRLEASVLVMLFVWAPVFCIGELCIAGKNRNYGGDEPRDEDDEEEFEVFAPSSLFKNKAVYELGFGRSARFVVDHLALMLQLFLLASAAHLVPMAAVDLLSGSYVGFWEQALKIALSSFFGVLAVAAGVGAFTVSLPSADREDLGIASLPLFLVRRIGRIPFRRKLPALFVLGALTLGAMLIVLQTARHQRDMPPGVGIRMEASGLADDGFSVTLELSDTEHHLRWLDARSLRLAYEKMEHGTVMGLSSMNHDSRMTGEAGQNLLTVQKVEAYLSDGTAVDSSVLGPLYQPLKLSLRYPPPSKTSEQLAFLLFHVSLTGKMTLLARGAVE